MNATDPPANSQIKQREDMDGITYYWKKSSMGFMRIAMACFLCVWLVVWTSGLVNIISDAMKPDLELFDLLFMAPFLLGELFGIYMLYILLRPDKPESVTLGAHTFKYDTGRAMMNMWNSYEMMRKKQTAMNPFAMLSPKRKIYKFDRPDCPEFVLEGFGDEQRLRFDDGADRVNIGEYLKEPEREWLAGLLITWRGGS